MKIAKNKFIIKDEDGKEFEVIETSDESEDIEKKDPEVKDDETLTPDEIAALKELAKHSTDIIALLTPAKEDGCDAKPEAEKDETIIETKPCDSAKSVGSIETKPAKDSVSLEDSEMEIAESWDKMYKAILNK